MAECIVCKGNYAPGSRCPRCDADNSSWEQWRMDHRGLTGWMDFMAPRLYLPVVLTALVLPVGIAGMRSLWLTKHVVWPWAVLVLGVLTFVCLLILGATYEGRNHLRESELLNQVIRGPARLLGVQYRVMGIPIVVVIAILAWTTIILSQPAPGEAEQNNLEHLLDTILCQGPFSAATWGTMIDIITLGGPLSITVLGYVSLMPALVYSSSLSLVLSYTHRMNQRVPLPIFLNTVRLARLVRSEAEQECSNLGPKMTWEGMERTEEGGIKLTARYCHDRKVLEDLTGKKTDLPMHTKCDVVADPWGRIRSITPKSELQV